jgi:hypothetical protein
MEHVFIFLAKSKEAHQDAFEDNMIHSEIGDRLMTCMGLVTARKVCLQSDAAPWV